MIRLMKNDCDFFTHLKPIISYEFGLSFIDCVKYKNAATHLPEFGLTLIQSLLPLDRKSDGELKENQTYQWMSKFLATFSQSRTELSDQKATCPGALL